MNKKTFFNFKSPDFILAALVWLFTLTIYYLTKAASFSFWDCGEFIAAAHVLGLPHPPGSPLWIIIARIFSVLPIDPDISVRINMLSVVSSAFTAMFTYLIASRLLKHWFDKDNSSFTRLLIHGGSVCSAFYVAFGLTNWTNSVEAEVYGLSMMMIAACVYMGLLYLDRQGTPSALRLMLAIVFISFLGIGVHMTTFLAFPVLALLFILNRSAGRLTWFLVAIYFVLELYLIFALSSAPGEIPFYLPIGLVLFVYLFYVFSHDQIPRFFLYIAAGLVLSMLPVFGLMADALSRRSGGGELSASVQSILSVIGLVAFVATCLMGLYYIFQYVKGPKKREIDAQQLTAGMFVVAAIVLISLLHFPKGYHSFLVISSLLAIGLAALIWRHLNWPVLIAVAAVSLVIIEVRLFLFGIAIALVVVPIVGMAMKQRSWKSAMLILLMAVMGYSVHLFIPIRSALHPPINENNPSYSLKRTEDFIERKQYGSESMVERMFQRRAEWTHQFGTYPRMGFWRFFQEQYGIIGPRFVLLFLFGLFGIWEIVRRTPARGLPLLILILIGTVGLILYMNFADGTRQDPRGAGGHLEVRDRDYFFTPGFIYFGLAIGLGVTLVIQYIREYGSRLGGTPQKIITYGALVLLLMPALALGGNYHYCDRSRNHIAYEYGWNILQSCEPNSVLFTHGDNDTFSLWCLQLVYGVRTDVSVINLMLANSPWYVKQIPEHMGVDLGWTDNHIEGLHPFRLPDSLSLARRGTVVDGAVYAYLGEGPAVADSLLRLYGAPYGQAFRISDQMMDRIIYKYLGKRPICYSVTGGSEARRYLGHQIDSLVTLRGMTWAIDTSLHNMSTDVEYCWDFFMGGSDKFRADGISDPGIYKNEATARLTANWANGFLTVADSLRVAGDVNRAMKLAETAVERMPHAGDAVEFLAKLYADNRMVNSLDSLVANAPSGSPSELALVQAYAWLAVGDTTRAMSLYEDILRKNPSDHEAFDAMARVYFRRQEVPELKTLLQRWLQFNPNDHQVRGLLQQLQQAEASESGN
ncbi:MAG TPA: DUF2723 domain-containing protein [candidate division Zixibacteria bacterium]|nr:DUF2723 domain-containing protein [candidate division Zixibacteria bacterium]